MSNSSKLIIGLLAGALIVVGGVAIALALTAGGDSPEAAASPVTATAAERLSVADLMDRAGCVGDVIGTQLYSYETGRCDLGGSEVTIAAFDTAELRDQWVEFGRDFGGTFVLGDGWAAFVEHPAAADALAGVLGGEVS